MAVKLTLRDTEYEVKSGMMLLDALKKCGIVPESVIATRDGEMILDDEILKDGDEVKLIAVISGGSMSLRGGFARRSNPRHRVGDYFAPDRRSQ
ncbi:MAG: MoaD/ThiS family protein [Chloroflexota bacterium]